MQPSAIGAKPLSAARLFQPTPDDLRLLVLDYLCQNSFSSTAHAFMMDSGVKPSNADGDEIMPLTIQDGGAATNVVDEKLAIGELRKAIKIHILSGQVNEATELLNEHFPSVLSESSDSGPSGHSADGLKYIPSASVNPVHLALNLHILAFIEAARTVPLPYYPPGVIPPASDFSKAVRPDIIRQEDPEEANVQLLHRAQNLYSEAIGLPNPDDRGKYLRELAQVGGLLAYKVPEYGPMASYMTQDRRDAVADQIDGAILYRTGQSAVSTVELAARQASVVWSTLHEIKVRAPPSIAWPAGLLLPGLKAAQSSAAGRSGDIDPMSTVKKPGADGGPAEILPPFDLHAFLDAGP
ncbi:uncharacterized protein FIBRA_06781 [Fibroporia radiculosa]|uniref:CRA domain-containing protein n=1 Tax=Fibroporia radiculosa TaxID=599839 RepID=J4H494_9APHY|nr:uncharacterized protein FIBRA_06781 [Fibroporia radiculosa]CCM04599.1 predicted protein [Fibroporia radiculosa]